MSDSNSCVQDLFGGLHKCSVERSLANDEMGPATLSSPADEGCGDSYDPGILNIVDARARDGQYFDTSNCAELSAQSLCGITGMPQGDAHPAVSASAFGEDAKGQYRRHKCFCSIIQGCNAQVLPHYFHRTMQK